MLAVDRGICVADGSSAFSVPSSELQQFIQHPLLYISRWYGSNPLQGQGAVEREPQPGNEGSDAAAVKLHENAASYRSSLKAGTASILLQQAEEGVQLLTLPVGVHLHIFSFLDARSLCRLSQTCSYLHLLTEDPLLWSRMLRRDVHAWRVIGHLSHPKVYEDVSSDLSPKQIYSNCCQHRTALPHHSFTQPLASQLRSLVRRIQGHVPRVLVFGSGLETLPFVRTLMWEQASPYRPVGLCPGKDGVGSGVCVQHKNRPINLITLYTATRAERKAAAAEGKMRVNKLVSAYSSENSEGLELTQAVQELCRQASAFVLVVDTSKVEGEALQLDLTMLATMLHSGSQSSALLVLACQMDEQSSALSPAQVADRLDLCTLTHPWQVRSLVITTYNGIQEGFDWLLGTTHN